MEKAKARRETVFKNLADETSALEEEEEKQAHRRIEEQDEVEEANEGFARAYSKWNKEQQSQSDDMLRQETIAGA